MDLSTVIQRLRTNCASFSNRVAGAAEFGAARAAGDEDIFPVPHAFVLPGDDSAEPSLSAGRVDQVVNEGATVYLCVDNTAEDDGVAAINEIETLKTEIFAALLGWQPSAQHGGLEYRTGERDDVTRARLWYALDFGASIIIGES